MSDLEEIDKRNSIATCSNTRSIGAFIHRIAVSTHLIEVFAAAPSLQWHSCNLGGCLTAVGASRIVGFAVGGCGCGCGWRLTKNIKGPAPKMLLGI